MGMRCGENCEELSVMQKVELGAKEENPVDAD